MVTTGWYSKLGEKIWTPWFIKFVHSRGYFNLYTNFLNERALSVSYRDVGVNSRRKSGPDSRLIDFNGTSDINLWEMKPLKELKRYDYCFQEVSLRKPVTTHSELKKILPSLHVGGEVILVNTLGLPEVLVRNWLCCICKLGFKHYLLLAEGKFVKDLSRRGHAVIQTNSSTGAANTDFMGTQHEDFQMVKWDLVTVEVVRWILQLGYNVWLTNVDTLWVEDPFNHISGDDAHILGIKDKDGLMTGLVYFRGSDKVIELCKNVWREILGRVESFNNRQHRLGFHLWQHITKSRIKVKILSRSLIADMLTVVRAQKNNLTVKYPLLSGPEINNLQMVVHNLKVLGLWMVDEEFACTGIFCHA
eukprot:c27984_g1_i2 orf=1169-2251(+)